MVYQQGAQLGLCFLSNQSLNQGLLRILQSNFRYFSCGVYAHWLWRKRRGRDLQRGRFLLRSKLYASITNRTRNNNVLDLFSILFRFFEFQNILNFLCFFMFWVLCYIWGHFLLLIFFQLWLLGSRNLLYIYWPQLVEKGPATHWGIERNSLPAL